ncbi:hypothetical protein PC9H_005166 [Pleurotus ostreatus]|uniref:Uncharacterized protein n=2 Tax=Pleurotus ostreatus TaxID=5322 RepID=A0A8H6ZZ24_PLEOS|nr:uncharacterized protein PC9H_005166 [Pleurotus ostreatus]KAF7433216.1 hypothetical protein PC9H_005166 [Pleurotus ostreatus]KAJ8698136.1 hypothetical protein PTI98_004874 [Pleurotus ostreatus]
MSNTRSRQREDVDRAYDIQTRAGIEGAVRGTGVGTGLAMIAHFSWPWFRRQTLPFKSFLVSISTIFGLVLGAERALLTHEADRRREENALRRQARYDLARRGLIGTETEIAKWRAERDAALQAEQAKTE